MCLFYIFQNRVQNKSVNFRSLQFDFLRFSTTLLTQIYARKTHAESMSVHKPYLS